MRAPTFPAAGVAFTCGTPSTYTGAGRRVCFGAWPVALGRARAAELLPGGGVPLPVVSAAGGRGASAGAEGRVAPGSAASRVADRARTTESPKRLATTGGGPGLRRRDRDPKCYHVYA